MGFDVAAIRALKDRHSGACAILANGPSLNDYDLGTIPIPSIGVNAAWQHPTRRNEIRFWPTYHVCLETIHAERHRGNALGPSWHPGGEPCCCPEVYEKLASEGRLITAGSAWPEKLGSIRIPCWNHMPGDATVFSQDLTQGVITSLGTCGTVSLAAMQIARWLGFTTAYMVGLDLGGNRKFNGRPVGALDRQRELFKIALPGIKAAGLEVKVIGLQSCAKMFDRIPWPW